MVSKYRLIQAAMWFERHRFRGATHGQTPRERMISAARKLFGIMGFHGTTTADLAAEAAASMGQIYRLFASRTM